MAGHTLARGVSSRLLRFACYGTTSTQLIQELHEVTSSTTAVGAGCSSMLKWICKDATCGGLGLQIALAEALAVGGACAGLKLH
ncbi:hypothetical protein PI124_g14885 [Phytophthora idaei]|nr:hypothetical protein PI125_g17341 [Phytophthora idaei]KAG3142672.1 hypothetical protein PI126_g14934 [Phytophthora idaei]KAG3240209.1 hypothetical protein PI124_g14885 [Phytophthora idaei]